VLWMAATWQLCSQAAGSLQSESLSVMVKVLNCYFSVGYFASA
jgi:hypothetical protein